MAPCRRAAQRCRRRSLRRQWPLLALRPRRRSEVRQIKTDRPCVARLSAAAAPPTQARRFQDPLHTSPLMSCSGHSFSSKVLRRKNTEADCLPLPGGGRIAEIEHPVLPPGRTRVASQGLVAGGQSAYSMRRRPGGGGTIAHGSSALRTVNRTFVNRSVVRRRDRRPFGADEPQASGGRRGSRAARAARARRAPGQSHLAMPATG
jgi:hypothetical protein